MKMCKKNIHPYINHVSRRGCQECRKLTSKIYSKANKDKINATSKAWRLANPEKSSAQGKNWRKTKPHLNAAKEAKRRSAKLLRTPLWLCEQQLLEIMQYYELAAHITKETNIRHEVDHIIPLQGKNVSGLHVPWNLQIITEIENCSKGNRCNLG